MSSRGVSDVPQIQNRKISSFLRIILARIPSGSTPDECLSTPLLSSLSQWLRELVIQETDHNNLPHSTSNQATTKNVAAIVPKRIAARPLEPRPTAAEEVEEFDSVSVVLLVDEELALVSIESAVPKMLR